MLDPRWVKPLDGAIAEAARRARLVVTVEDNGVVGGFGDAVCLLLARRRRAHPGQDLRPAAALPGPRLP